MSGGPGAGRVGNAVRAPPGPVAWAAAAYLALLPLGMAVAVPVAGAAATLADLFLLLFLAAVAAALVAGPNRKVGEVRAPKAEGAETPEGREDATYGFPLVPGSGFPKLALGLLAGFGGWTLLAVLWSPHLSYALAKGAAYVGLAAGVAALAWSGLGWKRALDAWLVGTGLVLLAVVVVLVVGTEGWIVRLTYGGGSISGLPVPRLRGPFLHPNAFGDYLVLSGLFLWARWPAWTAESGPLWRRAGAGLLLGVSAFFLLLTVSTAWLAAGVLLVAWGRRVGRGRGPGGLGDTQISSGGARLEGSGPGPAARASGRWLGWALRACGAALAGVVLAGLVRAIRIEALGVELTTSGIRPRIWASAFGAVAEAPLIGVGSAPFLAEAVDPMNPGVGPVLWDAHNVYLSLMGQYGVVGFALTAGGVWLVVRRLRGRGARGSDGGWSGGDRSDTNRPGEDRFGAPREVMEGAEWGLRPRLRARARLALLGALLAIAVHGFTIAGEDLRHWWAVFGIAAMGASRSASRGTRQGEGGSGGGERAGEREG